MVNRVILIGNLGRDPEIRRLDNGASVANFSVATHENYKDRNGEWQENTEWHNIVAWRALADRAENSLKKGSLVYVEGKLTHRSYQDKDGNTRYITEVVASYFRLIPQSRDQQGPMGGPRASSETDSHTPAGEEADPAESADDFDTVPNSSEADDDLPF